ncbi:MAG: 50S ribosomal protein L11 methyltransferase, partial [Rickettsiales bacterium]|nr:50S ribosomal protein L11 methyltransferase [Rickettsiales bacterium]
ASDLQESAVLQTQRNAELNHVSDRIRCVQADGIRHPLIAASAPYDIILVNILYKVFLPWLRPLKDFLAPQGQLVLSGVLRWQADSLEEACVAAGFMKMQRYQKDDWVALCLSD